MEKRIINFDVLVGFGGGNPSEPVGGVKGVEQIEKIIVDWLKSDNENATYCAHLIASQFQQVDEKQICVDCEKEKQVHELCFECAVKLGERETYNSAIDEAIKHCDLDAREIRQITDDKINLSPSSPADEFKRGMLEMRAIVVTTLRKLKK